MLKQRNKGRIISGMMRVEYTVHQSGGKSKDRKPRAKTRVRYQFRTFRMPILPEAELVDTPEGKVLRPIV